MELAPLGLWIFQEARSSSRRETHVEVGNAVVKEGQPLRVLENRQDARDGHWEIKRHEASPRHCQSRRGQRKELRPGESEGVKGC